jgi:hypothetical protein
MNYTVERTSGGMISIISFCIKVMLRLLLIQFQIP